MASVGDQLRAAREKQNLSIYQLADLTKIRTDHLRALEAGDYQIFAAPVYIRGFVRTCGKALKLDVESLMQTLDGELAQTEHFKAPPALTPPQAGLIEKAMLALANHWRAVVGLLVVGLMLAGALSGYRVWQSGKKEDPLIKLGPGLYELPRDKIAEILPLSTNATNR